MMYRSHRRVVQFSVLVFVFLVPVLNLFEIYAVTGTLYAVNIGGLSVTDPVVILQAVFASGRLTVLLLGAALFPVLFALVFGRVWCGWMCPYHLLADGAAEVRRFFGERVLRRPLEKALPVKSSFKANAVRLSFLLFGTALAGAISIPVLNYVHAPGIFSTEAMIFVKERSLSPEFLFIAALLVMETAVLPRFWCRLFCPTGSFLSLFRAPFTMTVINKVKAVRSPCCTENHCSAVCPMGLAPFKEGGNLLCTNCAQCLDACPQSRLHFGGFGSK
ncbi:4Fe-4S binding protein [Desulfomonile tiedjei]|nr:4Fe-4S binding protein [Desulfomonile tiedjei]